MSRLLEDSAGSRATDFRALLNRGRCSCGRHRFLGWWALLPNFDERTRASNNPNLHISNGLVSVHKLYSSFMRMIAGFATLLISFTQRKHTEYAIVVVKHRSTRYTVTRR